MKKYVEITDYYGNEIVVSGEYTYSRYVGYQMPDDSSTFNISEVLLKDEDGNFNETDQFSKVELSSICIGVLDEDEKKITIGEQDSKNIDNSLFTQIGKMIKP